MSRAKKLLALASYATLTFTAACQVRTEEAPLAQDKPTKVVITAPALPTSMPIQESVPAPKEATSQPTQANTPIAVKPAETPAVARRKPAAAVSTSSRSAPAVRPLVGPDGRPASGNVMTRRVSSR
jgi:cytoskeletal protein RodZ